MEDIKRIPWKGQSNNGFINAKVINFRFLRQWQLDIIRNQPAAVDILRFLQREGECEMFYLNLALSKFLKYSDFEINRAYNNLEDCGLIETLDPEEDMKDEFLSYISCIAPEFKFGRKKRDI